MQTIRYGATADQEGDLYLPTTPRPAVVCLLHGGFWRMPYGRDQMQAMAEDIAFRGFAVWNLEYRRLGTPHAGWPGTMDDVAAGIDHLTQLVADGIDMDLHRVMVVGHSAGGQLALWSAAGNPLESVPHRVHVAAAVGLAPIADLARAYKLRLDHDVVTELLGGSPDEYPDRYRAASPIEMLPLGVTQLILHGTADDTVPVDIARRYARTAAEAGDAIRFIELPHARHMDYLDPTSEAYAILCRWLQDVVSSGISN